MISPNNYPAFEDPASALFDGLDEIGTAIAEHEPAVFSDINSSEKLSALRQRVQSKLAYTAMSLLHPGLLMGSNNPELSRVLYSDLTDRQELAKAAEKSNDHWTANYHRQTVRDTKKALKVLKR